MTRAHVDIAVLVETREPLEGRLDILSGDVANLLSLEDAHEPPVAVTVVHEDERVTLDDAGLALDGGGEGMEGIHEVKVDGLIGDRERRGAVVVDILLLAVVDVRVLLDHRVLLLFVRVVVEALAKVRVVVGEDLLAKVVRVLPRGPARHYRGKLC
jgi:hypothetical protein